MLNGTTADRILVDEISSKPKGNRAARRRAAAIERRATSGRALDAYNEMAAAKWGATLHPTKGWRLINHKRTVASTIVDMARKGFLGSSADMKEAFANA